MTDKRDSDALTQTGDLNVTTTAPTGIDIKRTVGRVTDQDRAGHVQRLASLPARTYPVESKPGSTWKPPGAMAAALERVKHLTPEERELDDLRDEEAAREEIRAQRRLLSHEAYAACRPDRYVRAAYSNLLPHQDKERAISGWWRTDSPTLVLAGPPGHGKTHSAFAVCNEVAADARDARTAPVNVRAVRAVDLRDVYLPPGAHAQYDDLAARARTRRQQDLMASELVLFDDVTAARGTDWVRERLHDLIDTRVTGARRRTIVTLNAPSPTEIGVALSDLLGAALASRLSDQCTGVWVEGESMRKFSRFVV